MKIGKIVSALMCAAVTITLAGCGSDYGAAGRTNNPQSSVDAVLEAGMAETDGTTEIAEKQKSETDDKQNGNGHQSGVNEGAPEPQENGNGGVIRSDTDGIDVDLTALSSTMVYSEVYNMMVSPEDYIGKTIKMDGQFSIYHDDATGNDYFACIIQDATACCSQGIEFVLTDDYTYPEDYPEEGGSIIVIGVFETYMEGEYRYCTLKNASLL